MHNTCFFEGCYYSEPLGARNNAIGGRRELDAETGRRSQPGVADLAQGLPCCLGCLGRVTRADRRRMVELRRDRSAEELDRVTGEEQTTVTLGRTRI